MRRRAAVRWAEEDKKAAGSSALPPAPEDYLRDSVQRIATPRLNTFEYAPIPQFGGGLLQRVTALTPLDPFHAFDHCVQCSLKVDPTQWLENLSNSDRLTFLRWVLFGRNGSDEAAESAPAAAGHKSEDFRQQNSRWHLRRLVTLQLPHVLRPSQKLRLQRLVSAIARGNDDPAHLTDRELSAAVAELSEAVAKSETLQKYFDELNTSGREDVSWPRLPGTLVEGLSAQTLRLEPKLSITDRGPWIQWKIPPDLPPVGALVTVRLIEDLLYLISLEFEKHIHPLCALAAVLFPCLLALMIMMATMQFLPITSLTLVIGWWSAAVERRTLYALRTVCALVNQRTSKCGVVFMVERFFKLRVLTTNTSTILRLRDIIRFIASTAGDCQ